MDFFLQHIIRYISTLKWNIHNHSLKIMKSERHLIHTQLRNIIIVEKPSYFYKEKGFGVDPSSLVKLAQLR